MAFSTSSKLRIEDDIITRIDKLRVSVDSKNKEAEQAQSELTKGKEELKSITKELISLAKKSFEEGKNMSSYSEHFMNFMYNTDKEKVKELLAKNKRTEELFNDKIKEQLELDNSSMLKLIKLMKTKEKTLHDMEDKTESLINKSIEKNIANGEYNVDFQVKYLAARAVRLKERKDFKEEENKVFSESSSRLSAMDFVADKLETEIPGYTDPED